MVSLLALSACSWGTGAAGQKIASFEKVNLNQVKYVVEAGTDASDQRQKRGSVLIFINKDQSVSLLEKADMYGQTFSWNKDSIFFADKDYDYFWDGEKLEKRAAPKANYIDGLVTLEDGRSRVAAYNAGSKDRSDYREEISLADQKASLLGITNRPMAITSACGNAAYGISLNRGPEGNAYLALNQLLQNQKPDPKVVAKSSLAGEETLLYSPSSPCINGQIAFLSVQDFPDDQNSQSASRIPSVEAPIVKSERPLEDYQQEQSDRKHKYVSTLELWDTKTFEHRIIPLTDLQGEPLALESEAVAMAYYSEASADSKELTWLAGTGQIMKTNLETGRTTQVGEGISKSEPGQSHWVVADFGYRIITVLDQDLENQKLTLYQFDRKTGDQVQKEDLSFVSQYLDGNKTIGGISVPPTD
ncbi:hypothetical protein BSR28_05510 [Boudabousia liubingyangii]|uniref:hypothetical protein n=1 Tax=Boudabousia liubingyangii TaxID=1921764 RepID=UPI000939F510|nr:hypothetical protein [Boudabousia liubingyangii]OKL46883.1 hypothetical protein BSR28_05510 [Boudabousia liubingyangii]